MKLTVDVRRISSSTGVSFYQDGNRPDEDFRHMPDLTDWHSGSLKFKEEARNNLSTRLRIHDGVFYTRERAVGQATREERSNPSNSVAINRIGRILGSDITCGADESGIEIAISDLDGTFCTYKLPTGAGPYEIHFRTSTSHEHEHDHLPMLYDDIVIPPDGKKYTLKYHQKESPWHPCRRGTKATEYACQTFDGGDGPPPLFP